ncbi:hypothetical protein [Methanothermobacter sp.]|uniref:hypothetical protein n=1 Tax=Methanothermobacter sp. TaxID=1884223 RepID=UPI003C716155
MAADFREENNGNFFMRWWRRRGTFTRAGIVVSLIIIWGLVMFIIGYTNGSSYFYDLHRGDVQAEVLNYTVLADSSGGYVVEGVVQNRYGATLLLDRVWVKGYNSYGKVIALGMAPVFTNSSPVKTLRPGEIAYFKTTEWEFEDGYYPADITSFGLTARGNLLTPSGAVCGVEIE